MGSDSLIGPLPPDWEATTLGEACRRGGGDIQTGPFGSQLHASDYVADGIPSIMPQNIGDNRVVETEVARITPHDAARLSRYLVRPGDIVYSRRGDVEKRSLIREHEAGWLCGTGCLRIRFGGSDVDPTYASYYLGHPQVRAWITQHAHGATMPNLNTEILSETPFVVPPLEDQRRIAGILGALDDKIDLNRLMSQTLESMARALFKSWFIDFDPVRAKAEGRDPGIQRHLSSLFPDALVDSELGPIPEGWHIEALGAHVTAERGISYGGAGLGSGDLPMHNLNSIYEGGGYKDGGIKFYAGEFRPRHVAQAGDLIVANTEQGHHRLLIGYAAIVPSRYPNGLFSHHLYRVKIVGGAPFSPEFLCALLNSDAMHETVSGYANGTTVNMLPMAGLQRPLVCVPPEPLVEAFTSFAKEVRLWCETQREAGGTLESLRDGLLPRVVAGDLPLGWARGESGAAR